MGRKLGLLDWLLIAIVLAGSVLAWRSGNERSRLTARYHRLVKTTGELPIDDPSLVYALALDTGESLNFAWHFYFPPNRTLNLSKRFGGQERSWQYPQQECVVRVVVRHDDQGRFSLYHHFETSHTSGSISISRHDNELIAFMQGRWDRLKIEQLGAPGLAVVRPDQPAVILRVSLPDDLQAEARKKLSAACQKKCLPVLLEITLDLPR